jgi:hypothetical protein
VSSEHPDSPSDPTISEPRATTARCNLICTQ